MREISPKIAYIDSLTVDSLEKELVFKKSRNPLVRQSFKNILLSLLFPGKNVLLFAFSLRNDLLHKKVELEELKSKGFIADYGEYGIFCDYPRFNFFRIDLSIEKDEQSIRSWGYSFPFEEKSFAVNKALWESLERQASFYVEDSTSVTYPKKRKGDASFLYDYVPRHSASQIKANQFFVSKKDDLRAIDGAMFSSLTKNGKTFLPLTLFYWGKVPFGKAEIIHELNTNASGGGSTEEGALLSALYESIERDLFLLFWYASVTPLRISIDDEEGEFFDYVRDAKERFNLEIYFLALSHDVSVASCVCVIVDPVLNIIATGGKASMSSERSMKGAFLEALAILTTLRSRKRTTNDDALKRAKEHGITGELSTGKEERVEMYCSSYGISVIKDMWINPAKVISYNEYKAVDKNFSDKKNELRYIRDCFKQLVNKKGEGYHIYQHFFSSKWLELTDYYVAHVFVPSFLHLHLLEQNMAVLSDRLKEFAISHGKVINNEHDINPLPHPFP